MTAAAAHRCLRFDVSLPEYQAQHRGTPSLMKTNTSASSRRILDSASNEVDHDNSDTEEAPRRPARIAVISSADINRVEATDDPNEFGAAESDAENDGGASDWDDSELDEGGTNDHKGEADGVGELLEPVFDESLLEALTNAESVTDEYFEDMVDELAMLPDFMDAGDEPPDDAAVTFGAD
ncbi:hypothetical protein PC121_g8751 [Phytophthora cactorum]|nr:hypothetical protein PC121_g8751 [Phytophthora cactorum]